MAYSILLMVELPREPEADTVALPILQVRHYILHGKDGFEYFGRSIIAARILNVNRIYVDYAIFEYYRGDSTVHGAFTIDFPSESNVDNLLIRLTKLIDINLQVAETETVDTETRYVELLSVYDMVEVDTEV